MSIIIPAKEVNFISDDVEDEFNELQEEGWLKKSIKRLIENLKLNAFCCEQIKKKLIPKYYIVNYDLHNLWWCPLPNGWRLVYSIVTMSDKSLMATIIEFFDHKDYERRFSYN